MTTRIQPASLLAALGLLATTGCQPPVVEAHIEPQHGHCEAADPPDGASKPANLTVTGTATLEVTPNVADVTLELSATAPNPRAAVAKLRSREEAMRKNLADEGMAPEDIVVSTLNLNPTSRWDGARQRQIPTGYDARLRVTVATEDFSQVPAIVEAGANAGVTTSSTAFRNSEMTTLKRKVRDMALDAAKAKAAQFQGRSNSERCAWCPSPKLPRAWRGRRLDWASTTPSPPPTSRLLPAPRRALCTRKRCRSS